MKKTVWQNFYREMSGNIYAPPTIYDSEKDAREGRAHTEQWLGCFPTEIETPEKKIEISESDFDAAVINCFGSKAVTNFAISFEIQDLKKELFGKAEE